MVTVALAQINPVVGDINGNTRRIQEAMSRADDLGAQVVVVPELALTGYPPDDLLLKTSFIDANHTALGEIASSSGDALAVLGFVDQRDGSLFNAAAACRRGQVVGVYHKHLLPNYGVFDERRYFEPGEDHLLFDTPEAVLSVSVCEDAWSEDGPVVQQGLSGAQIVININASPYDKNKLDERTAMLADRARRAGASIVYVNTVGGQDELVFDGSSLVVSPYGQVMARLKQFEEDFALVDVPLGHSNAVRAEGPGASIRRVRVGLPPAPSGEVRGVVAEALSVEAEIYGALCLGLADYVNKNNFKKVVVGLSGGIDSALTAVIAADALGAECVLGVSMPSVYTSPGSRDDADILAHALGVQMIEVPIRHIQDAYLEALQSAFGQTPEGLAEENLQARARGNILMAISNRYGHLVIATGNKSEMACGYATLYGDMAGGFALLKDVFKTEVYSLSHYRNSISPVIPESVLTKAPSAELRSDQKDEDSLPPYSVLDPILEAYIEREAGVADIVALGHGRDVVGRVITLVDRAEYKRRQAPPGPKVTDKAFGRDRRLPITNQWKEGPDEDLPARATGGGGEA
ncbi:MAG: NAD+ synthase [Actinobacteria bacterium]|nr:NAD+ synthase [Actinomycetota bacterium]